MRLRQTPFNISLLDPQSDVFFGLREVSALAMFDSVTQDFNDDGLFSNDIFGRQGERDRAERMAFIDLKIEVFHPLYFEELTALKGLYGGILRGTAYATWNDTEKDFEQAPVLQGETGWSFFMKHFHEIKFKRNRSRKRSTRINFIEKFKDRAFMRRHIVIPAAMRDVEFEDGRPVEDDLNPLYRTLISNANTINPALVDDDEGDEVLDRAKATMQRSVNAVYNHIFNIIKGKRGFLMSKVASRRVAGTTRNVISSMETGSNYLGDPRQPDIDTVQVGLPQFISGVRPIMIHEMRKGPFSSFFRSEGQNVQLVNKDSLELVDAQLKSKTVDKWMTKDGLETLMASFLEPHIRHKPIEIDGHYLGLIYQDSKSFRIMNGIDELPEGFDKDKVRPLTYAEFFYYHAQPVVERIRHFATRYPVTEAESIKAGVPYLKTTVTTLQLEELNEDFGGTGVTFLEFPDTLKKVKFFETQAVHPAGLSSYGADFDGDGNRWRFSSLGTYVTLYREVQKTITLKCWDWLKSKLLKRKAKA